MNGKPQIFKKIKEIDEIIRKDKEGDRKERTRGLL